MKQRLRGYRFRGSLDEVAVDARCAGGVRVFAAARRAWRRDRRVI
jgi:hypothetical protein